MQMSIIYTYYEIQIQDQSCSWCLNHWNSISVHALDKGCSFNATISTKCFELEYPPPLIEENYLNISIEINNLTIPFFITFSFHIIKKNIMKNVGWFVPFSNNPTLHRMSKLFWSICKKRVKILVSIFNGLHKGIRLWWICLVIN